MPEQVIEQPVISDTACQEHTCTLLIEELVAVTPEEAWDSAE